MLAELEAVGLVTLADKGYQGSTWAKNPYKGKNKSEPQKSGQPRPRELRGPSERANAQLKTWKIFSKLRCCPWHAPGNSPRPSTYCSSARHNQDEKAP